MTRQVINRTCGIAPIIMSVIALALVIVAVATGWQTNQPDEGVAARLFQLLIFTQPLIVLVYLATADWKRSVTAIAAVALQVLAATATLGTLLYFESRGL